MGINDVRGETLGERENLRELLECLNLSVRRDRRYTKPGGTDPPPRLVSSLLEFK